MRKTSATTLKNALFITLLTCSTTQILNAAPSEHSNKLKVGSTVLTSNEGKLPNEKTAKIAAFNIIVQSNQTILSWSTIEVKNGKYLIYRSEDQHNFVKIGEKEIVANANEPALYIFHDEAPAKGLNHYKLMQQDPKGNLKEVASKQVFLDSKEPNVLSHVPTPKINRI
ncbi:hypothetical protein D3C87_212340 [compost metagenome]